MELLFDANKIFVSSNKYKAPDLHLTLVVLSVSFPVMKALRRRQNGISHTLGCLKELPIF